VVLCVAVVVQDGFPFYMGAGASVTEIDELAPLTHAKLDDSAWLSISMGIDRHDTFEAVNPPKTSSQLIQI
jgi:hypothetical protein